MSTTQIVMAVITYLLIGILTLGYGLRMRVFSVWVADVGKEKFAFLFLWPCVLVLAVIAGIIAGIVMLAEKVAGE